ncbi:hypothetical protein Vretimale_15481 [Volvox reticuliferus]|uniref:Uncharacterized protein n=1 Tax=Volvox reticuliferus TaxID=1737510 RepID=A0A8J4D3H9_9CHLO|nr:hypothetical protein Vretifemale_20455 [Volvox reticuliferus]GIM12027.1 hypothetical protein Vretimale_15481 [Volvox reticuliferus]
MNISNVYYLYLQHGRFCSDVVKSLTNGIKELFASSNDSNDRIGEFTSTCSSSGSSVLLVFVCTSVPNSALHAIPQSEVDSMIWKWWNEYYLSKYCGYRIMMKARITSAYGCLSSVEHCSTMICEFWRDPYDPPAAGDPHSTYG